MAEGMKLLQKRVVLQDSCLNLRPEGRRVKYGCNGWWGSWAMCSDLRMVAVLMRAGKLGVGRPIIFEQV